MVVIGAYALAAAAAQHVFAVALLVYAADSAGGSAADPTTDPVAWLINYGVAGAVIVLLVTGQLRTKSEVTGLKEANDQLRADLLAERAGNAALVNQISNHTLPQMNALADVLERVPKAGSVGPDPEVRAVLENLTAMVSGLEKRFRGEA